MPKGTQLHVSEMEFESALSGLRQVLTATLCSLLAGLGLGVGAGEGGALERQAFWKGGDALETVVLQ